MSQAKCKTCIHNGCHYDVCINCNGENLYNYKSNLLTQNIFQLKDIQYFISKIGEYEDLNKEDIQHLSNAINELKIVEQSLKLKMLNSCE